MRTRLTVGTAFAALVLLVTAAPAWAHVTVSPKSATRGGFVTLTFQVPNEMENASTTKLEVHFPQDHPIADASVKAVAGWKIEVEKKKLTTPVTTDEGESLDEAVGAITWTSTDGSGVAPGYFQQFQVSVGLPSDGDALTFPALQTYSNGEVVRWVDVTTPDGPEAEHPAPTLQLAATAESPTPATTPAATVSTTGLATASQVDSARTIGIVGVVLGALGLVVAIWALASRRRSA